MAGGGLSNFNSQQQTPMGGGSSPLNTGGGMSGGQTQMPSFATPNMQRYETNEPFSLAHGPNTFGGQQQQFGTRPFSSVNSTTQQDMMRGGSGMPFGQRLGQFGFGGFGGQPQQPSFMQDPEYQGYQTQANDLQRQMDEYMRKAPMYQQLQDLQGKMAPFQQRQAMQQRQFQQPSPFRRGQYIQPQGLMGLLGGRGMPQAQSPMYAEFPQNFGREQRYSVPAYSANYSGMSSATRAAMEAEAAKAAQAAAPAYDPYASGFSSGW